MTKTTAVYSQSNLLELGDGNTNACDIFMDGRLPFDCSSFDAFVRLRRPHLLRMNMLFLISKKPFHPEQVAQLHRAARRRALTRPSMRSSAFGGLTYSG